DRGGAPRDPSRPPSPAARPRGAHPAAAEGPPRPRRLAALLTATRQPWIEPQLPPLGLLEPREPHGDEDDDADGHHLQQHHAAPGMLVGERGEAPGAWRGDVRHVVRARAPEEKVRQHTADEPDEPERAQPGAQAEPPRPGKEAE